MKTRHEILIDAPREAVWAAFDDAGSRPRWQPTLKSRTQKSGEPGAVGSVAECVYDERGRKIVITETVTERREPDFLAGVHTTQWGRIVVVNHFEDAGGDRTRWVVYANHFFEGIMKVVSVFTGRRLRERTERDLERFKLMVESAQAGNA